MPTTYYRPARIILLKTRIVQTKLTLTLEKDTIEKAKIYARQSGRSLSALIEAHLKAIVATDAPEEVPEAFRDLFGVIDLPTEVTDKHLIRSILTEKHTL